MAGTHIKVEVLKREVDEAVSEMPSGDPGWLSNRIGEYVLGATKDRFDTQRAPDNTPWQPLKRSYARRKKYHQDKILMLRGYLRRQIYPQLEGPWSVLVHANMPYAAAHQLGAKIQHKERKAVVRFRTEAGRKLFAKRSEAQSSREVTIGAHETTLPARPFLGISQVDEQRIMEIVGEWLQEKRGNP
ncbi:phage virion morphogenesis protein [Variovorax sp.]|uniref:phage virion morphogenesis protein n=1 Tax=Variovorax sp. TaxID=1871043 RepID=UPI003BA8878A